PELLARADDSDRDLAAVGDQDLREHAAGTLAAVGALRTRANRRLLHADHPSARNRVIGRLVDQNEAAGGPVAGVWVARERRGAAQANATDLVQRQLRGRHVLEGVDVDAVVELVDDRPRAAGRVLDRVPAARLHRLLAHPADRRLELARADRLIIWLDDHV